MPLLQPSLFNCHGCRRPTVLTPPPASKSKHPGGLFSVTRSRLTHSSGVHLLLSLVSGASDRPELAGFRRAPRSTGKAPAASLSTESNCAAVTLLSFHPCVLDAFAKAEMGTSKYRSIVRPRTSAGANFFLGGVLAVAPLLTRVKTSNRPDAFASGGSPHPGRTDCAEPWRSRFYRPWHGQALKSASALVGAVLWAAAVPSSSRAEVLALGVHPSQRLLPGSTSTAAAR